MPVSRQLVRCSMLHYESKKVENCFSGANVYEYRLDIRLDEEYIESLGLTGEIHYYRKFPRPFFQVTFTDGTQVKGIINATIIKVVFPDMSIEPQQKFEKLLAAMLQKKLCR
jgi:hypothetical protein